RAGLTSVVLPVRNGPDLEDVPEAVRDEMTFHLAAEIGEVLDAALATDTAEVPATSKHAAGESAAAA
ncbi:MAG: S16 family serine protease, partial [Acidimicrobiales bacterium]